MSLWALLLPTYSHPVFEGKLNIPLVQKATSSRTLCGSCFLYTPFMRMWRGKVVISQHYSKTEILDKSGALGSSFSINAGRKNNLPSKSLNLRDWLINRSQRVRDDLANAKYHFGEKWGRFFKTQKNGFPTFSRWNSKDWWLLTHTETPHYLRI